MDLPNQLRYYTGIRYVDIVFNGPPLTFEELDNLLQLLKLEIEITRNK